MDEMAKLLLDKDTIYQEDVDKLMSGTSAELVARDMEKREIGRASCRERV